MLYQPATSETHGKDSVEGGGVMPTNHWLNSERNTMRQRGSSEVLTHVDDVEIEKRPAPPVTRAVVMRTRFYCSLCVRLCDALDYDSESGIVKLDCRPIAHFRPVAVKTVGAA